MHMYVCMYVPWLDSNPRSSDSETVAMTISSQNLINLFELGFWYLPFLWKTRENENPEKLKYKNEAGILSIL
jgi:hypothetical protein